MPEYGCDIPLWPDDWRELTLSSALLTRLAEWQTFFDSNYHHEIGWRSADARENWSDQTATLVSELRRELPPDLPLEVDLWPIERARPWWRFWSPKHPTTTYH